MTKISPGQAILLLIEKYQTEKMHIAKKLEKMYLTGVTQNDRQFLNQLIAQEKEGCLKGYCIAYQLNEITNDSTRRYFETKLSYETLKSALCDLDQEKIAAHFANLLNVIKKINHNIAEFFQLVIEAKLSGNMAQELQAKIKAIDLNEYQQMLSLINTKNRNKFTAEENEKIKLLVSTSLLSATSVVLHDLEEKSMPMALYGKKLFSTEARGRKQRIEDKFYRAISSWHGIMKSTSSLPLYDPALQLDENLTGYNFKPTENSQPISRTEWVEMTANEWTHPFVNSISGTMLMQLRACNALGNNNLLVFKNANDLSNFFKCFISAMLFHSGGHSLREFTAPISMKEVQEHFAQKIQGYENITFASLFYENNKKAFDKALNDTICYNRTLLNKQNFHCALFSRMAVNDNTPEDCKEPSQNMRNRASCD